MALPLLIWKIINFEIKLDVFCHQFYRVKSWLVRDTFLKAIGGECQEVNTDIYLQALAFRVTQNSW